MFRFRCLIKKLQLKYEFQKFHTSRLLGKTRTTGSAIESTDAKYSVLLILEISE